MSHTRHTLFFSFLILSFQTSISSRAYTLKVSHLLSLTFPIYESTSPLNAIKRLSSGISAALSPQAFIHHFCAAISRRSIVSGSCLTPKFSTRFIWTSTSELQSLCAIYGILRSGANAYMKTFSGDVNMTMAPESGNEKEYSDERESAREGAAYAKCLSAHLVSYTSLGTRQAASMSSSHARFLYTPSFHRRRAINQICR